MAVRWGSDDGAFSGLVGKVEGAVEGEGGGARCATVLVGDADNGARPAVAPAVGAGVVAGAVRAYHRCSKQVSEGSVVARARRAVGSRRVVSWAKVRRTFARLPVVVAVPLPERGAGDAVEAAGRYDDDGAPSASTRRVAGVGADVRSVV